MVVDNKGGMSEMDTHQRGSQSVTFINEERDVQNGTPYHKQNLALGYKQTHKAVERHVDDDGMKRPTPTIGGVQQLLYVNESSHYSLILVSKFESAKRFKHQVTSEVLPAIRKREAFVTKISLNTIVVQQCENIYKYGCSKTRHPLGLYNS